MEKTERKNKKLDKRFCLRYTKHAFPYFSFGNAPDNFVIKFPCSRGDSGALYLQSAPAGVMSHLGQSVAELPCVSGDDVWVLRNRTL